MRYIFVSGGVVSGLGKGITAASTGLILSSLGFKTTNLKIDMYLNVDAGTIRPQEHGEVFVTQDGLETDQDLGNYERFTSQSLHRENYLTTGQIYQTVINRERSFGYEGEDVEAVPHVTDEIIRRIKLAGKRNKAEIVIVELGGTVGEYQNILFFEASRILHLREPRKVIHIHVTYLPFLKSLGELKSKPAQQSSQALNALGIQPDFIVARAEKDIDQKRRQKLAIFSNLDESSIISAPDLESIYQVPAFLENQNFGEKILKKLHLHHRSKNRQPSDWTKFVNRLSTPKNEVAIAMVGKYFQTGDYKLSDSYVSVIEAIKQAGCSQKIKPNLYWIDSQDVENGKVDLSKFNGIIVPQGWGSRGTEGKIKAAQFARENKIPYLGLCFGMQMAVIEYARHKAGLKQANSTEVDQKTPHPVIHVMPDQIKYLKARQYGGTIRLGSWPCLLKKGSLLKKLYKKYGQADAPYHTDKPKTPIQHSGNYIYERHRHRYELNNEYRQALEKAGLIISGTSPDNKLVEAIELKNHPFFVGTQFHPEYIARPKHPHPIFQGFIKACQNRLK